ncbi:5'-nucleotidase [Lasiodiplodia theobromae]|uniref:5'-nucleotidase n=1 Tax=Lasiodiplodia theobromae TaxID=45133 RepID=UPI0015C3A160|nr:5'-nucleotidase [Lasiodiplodia theobromae]KAF4545834.1 5'-nucleotidase [Lasiodiplodia theobromae]
MPGRLLPSEKAAPKLQPDLRIIHFNDVYNIQPDTREPAGGIARFQTVMKKYRAKHEGQPPVLTLFSGDALNPSLESIFTKGEHMVEALNNIGVNFACLGNHELDFGVPHFQKLSQQCNFPWLCANVLDPALGPDVPLGNCKKTAMVDVNGVKVGLIGLVEREWLATVNVLPPNLVFRPAAATAAELVPALKAAGADVIVALTHQREPNDVRLAQECGPGLIDVILAGHDHFYSDTVVNGVRIVRSGTDFKQLSYIELRRRQRRGRRRSPRRAVAVARAARPRGVWDIKVVREDVTAAVPEDPDTRAWVDGVSSMLRAQLEKPVGVTGVDLDARFTTVRRCESNMGNFITDAMRQAYGADCCIISSGTMRGDQVYAAGVLTVGDIRNCLPFEDPTVVIRVSGQAIWAALENSVSLYPALEGRFPQVSAISFDFDASMPPFKRVKSACIGGLPIKLDAKYLLATRDYMARGKDGYTSLVGDDVEVVVGPEEGDRIYKIVLDAFSRLQSPEVGLVWPMLGAYAM